ncbi:MAG: hypothetical protein EXR21_02845 [Flavobacteriaceae bacterium]|nr:hypothetical protein [Flavobacteriaceae bacterium]
MSFSASYSLWYLLLCILAGVAGAYFLYRNNKIEFEQNAKFWKWLLYGLRFLSISLICLLLFNPLVKTIIRRTEKPLILVAIDNSQSIVAGKDSAFYRKEFTEKIKALKNEIGSEFEVMMLSFGELTKENETYSFAEKQSDLGGLMKEIEDRYENQNLGGIVLATDGIYNKGNNPAYECENLKVPVFTIALGDTTERRDIKIKSVRHNEVAYTGNIFPMQVQVDAKGCLGENAALTVTENGQSVFYQNISVNADVYSTNISFTLAAKQPGTRHFTISVARLKNEITYSNNIKDMFVEVMDSRQKVLLVANSPHPDISAIRQSIESNKNYELKIFMANEIGKIGDIKSYNMAICHQLPSATQSASGIIGTLKVAAIPILYIYGQQSNIGVLNNLNTPLNIQQTGGGSNDASAVINSSFGLFTISETFQSRVKNFPPLLTVFANYRLTGETDVLAHQQIGYVKTNNPLILFNKNPQQKCGVIAGEGLWRWRLSEMSQFGNADAFDELVSKLLQYLATKEDKRPFRIVTDKKYFLENEPVHFDAELYNESYELVNKPDVRISIFDAIGKKYNYVFSKAGNAYTLEAGMFPPGNYNYKAYTALNSKEHSLVGQFSVIPLQVELTETQANHQLLATISRNTGGQLVYPKELEKLAEKLKINEEIKPVTYTDRKTKDLIHFRWLFAALFLFLGTEWVVRKLNGTV